MLEAEMVVLALEAVTLGCLIDAGLIAAFPGAIGDFGFRFRRMGARVDADPVKELGIYSHQS
jgi:hypothetical protein